MAGESRRFSHAGPGGRRGLPGQGPSNFARTCAPVARQRLPSACGFLRALAVERQSRSGRPPF
jgi:hypothetical protein